MPSRADGSRLAAERALRVAALALVAFAVVRVWRPASSAAPVARFAWTTTPGAATRDSVAALRRAGVTVAWQVPGVEPLAMSLARASAPDGSVRIATVGAPMLVLRDAAGAADTLRDATNGAVLLTAEPSGALTASGARSTAIARAPRADSLRGVLVIGRASWETKFATAALEEAGWRVETRVGLAPGATLRDASAGTATLDPRRLAAVVALDSSVLESAQALAAFVRAGGGLVLAGEASALPALRALAPARGGALLANVSLTFDAADPRGSLRRRPLDSLRADAVPLERHGGDVVAAARRDGAGRVVQVAYEDDWRWRMEGGDDAVAQHRAWWTRTVAAAVAPAVPPPFASRNAEGAPLARLVDALGAPSTTVSVASVPRGLPGWLLPLLFVILLAEWGSRRTRGAR